MKIRFLRWSHEREARVKWIINYSKSIAGRLINTSSYLEATSFSFYSLYTVDRNKFEAFSILHRDTVVKHALNGKPTSRVTRAQLFDKWNKETPCPKQSSWLGEILELVRLNLTWDGKFSFTWFKLLLFTQFPGKYRKEQNISLVTWVNTDQQE